MAGGALVVRTTLVPMPGTRVANPSSAARALALAHHVHRLVQDGTLDSHSEAARRLGICRRHLTFINHLALLAPNIQAAILSGDVDVPEYLLRHVARHIAWADQRRALNRIIQERVMHEGRARSTTHTALGTKKP